MSPSNDRPPLAQIQRVTLVLMIAAPLMLLFFIALTFGLFGPVEGIQTITN